MISIKDFKYTPGDNEKEKASNGYLMSILAIVIGLPLPITNLLCTVIFYFANRKSTYFVRWHTTQALLSQLGLFFINSVGSFWTIRILFTDWVVTNNYISYLLTLLLINLSEFILSIYCAIKVGKGFHFEQFFFGEVTNAIVKSK